MPILTWSKKVTRTGDLLGANVKLIISKLCCCSVTVMSSSLRPHGLQHASLSCLSCPSPSPSICSNSCLLSQWCHPTISPSVVPFSTCPQSFPALGSFPMSWLFASGGQNNRASDSVSVYNKHSVLISFRIGWFDFLQSKELRGSLKTCCCCCC